MVHWVFAEGKGTSNWVLASLCVLVGCGGCVSSEFERVYQVLPRSAGDSEVQIAELSVRRKLLPHPKVWTELVKIHASDLTSGNVTQTGRLDDEEWQRLREEGSRRIGIQGFDRLVWALRLKTPLGGKTLSPPGRRFRGLQRVWADSWFGDQTVVFVGGQYVVGARDVWFWRVQPEREEWTAHPEPLELGDGEGLVSATAAGRSKVFVVLSGGHRARRTLMGDFESGRWLDVGPGEFAPMDDAGTLIATVGVKCERGFQLCRQRRGRRSSALLPSLDADDLQVLPVPESSRLLLLYFRKASWFGFPFAVALATEREVIQVLGPDCAIDELESRLLGWADD